MLFVGFGGMFGAIARFLLGKWIMDKSSSTFPLGTWVINITGSFFLGILASLHGINSLPEWVWLLVGTGFLGSYTTFSTFGYETIQMMKTKRIAHAVIYVSFTVILGVLFAWLGFLVVGGLT